MVYVPQSVLHVWCLAIFSFLNKHLNTVKKKQHKFDIVPYFRFQTLAEDNR